MPGTPRQTPISITGAPTGRFRERLQCLQSQGQGPVIANVTPGVWMLANSHLPSGLNTAPAHSFCFMLSSKVRPEGRVSEPKPPA